MGDRGKNRWIKLVLGPGAYALLAVAGGMGLTAGQRMVLGLAVWMTVWWVTEVVPLAVTALLPLLVLPVAGVESVRQVAPNYGKDMIFLFLGGFVVALAVERSGAHRRLALLTVRALGGTPRRLVWGFTVAAGGLSMWLSNTATTLMMLPIAAAVAGRLQDRKTSMRLFLGVAFGAGIGGLGTLVGTPPNLVLVGMAPALLPDAPAITFGGWMLFGVPTAAILLMVAGLLLARGLHGGPDLSAVVRGEAARLGPLSPPERRSLLVLAGVALLWITRADLRFGVFTVPGWSHLLPDPKLVTDAVPAVAAAVVAALVPAGGGESRSLVTWEEVRHGVPWGVLLLFGGGFALADGIHTSGLDGWLASRLHGLAGMPATVVVLAVVLVTVVVTNMTSNTATATLLMPVMAALGKAIGEPPYLLMVAATVAASCAFMLPVATPPNAIVMGSGAVTARDMFREGVRLNVAAALIVTGLVLTLGRVVLPLG